MYDMFDAYYNDDNEYDKCYELGSYEDQYCPQCPHRFQCSAYNEED